MKNSLKYSVSATFGLALVLFVACGKEDTVRPTAGRVRFFNAVSDAPVAGMDLIVDGTPINLRTWLTAGTPLPDSTFKYGAGFPISSDSSYLYLTDGSHNIKLNAIGTTTTSLNFDMPVAAGKTYTVFATDSLSKISAVIATDDILPPVNKKAVFRFANMVPDAPALDIARIKGTDTTVIFSNIAYKTVTPFIQVDTSASTVAPFKVDYAIRPAGKTNTLKAWTSASFANGRVYTLVARGFVGKTGTQAINATVITQSR